MKTKLHFLYTAIGVGVMGVMAITLAILLGITLVM